MKKDLKVALFIALKTITKGNKVVFSLIVFILIFVYLNIIFIPSLLDGLVTNINNKLINTSIGNYLVESNGGDIKEVQKVFEALESVEGVISSTSHNTVAAELSANNRKSSWGLTAIDPIREKNTFTTADYMVQGRFLETGDKDKIVLGMQVAGLNNKNLELYSDSLQSVGVGDMVLIKYGNGKQKNYDVVGIFLTEYIQTDIKSFITNEEMESMISGSYNTATSIHVKTSNNNIKKNIEDKLAELGESYSVKTWGETAGIVKSMTKSFTALQYIQRIVAFLLGGVTIFIVTYIDLINRKKQIGIQRAIGVNTKVIIGSYIIRALIYSFLSISIAVILYIFIIIPLEIKFPFHFPFGNVYLKFNTNELVFYGLILILVAGISAYLPARYVAKMKIIDAIWGN